MNIGPIRILGIDPGLRNTGWGLIEAAGTRLTYVGCGFVWIASLSLAMTVGIAST